MEKGRPDGEEKERGLCFFQYLIIRAKRDGSLCQERQQEG
jgi:hypothetical protein